MKNVVYCGKCGETLTDLNSMKRSSKSDRLASYCKKCHVKYISDRMIKLKNEAIENMGGKCVDCDNKYPYQVYDFHHRDRFDKEFGWAEVRKMSKEKIAQELDKCDLLCANCHRIRHIVK